MTVKTKLITNKKLWADALSKHALHDFYHTYDYHQLSKKSNEKAYLFEFNLDDVYIHLPLLIRPIPDNDNMYDATSVYGYPGPLATKFENEKYVLENYAKALHKQFVELNIVSVFSRLNPYLPEQEELIKSLGDVETKGQVVNIDLSQTPEVQRSNYSKNTKRFLKKCHEAFDVRIGKTQKDLDEFIRLYYENMNRVNADSYYFFKKDYFKNFMESNDFEAIILIAELKTSKEIVSAALMVQTGDIIQYHLSGTAQEYLHLSPIRLLMDKMGSIGHKDGAIHFNLGGGLGGQNDSLLRFKASLSKDFKDFKLWKYVVDPVMYKNLTNKNQSNIKDMQSDFFPLYRV